MHSVMISYSHKDQQYANMIVAILEQNGVKCWIDYRDAMPGIDYAGSIVRAIKSADYVVVILSGNSIASAQVLNEIHSAVNNGVIIIPFKIDEAQLNDGFEYYLGKTHWLDAITPPMEEHVYQLVHLIQGQKDLPRETFSAPRVTSSATSSSGLGTEKHACRMLKYNEMLEIGYTSQSIAMQLVENDYVNYNGIGGSNEGSAEQWEEFLRNNSDTCQYLVNGENRIVGDWQIVALDDAAYERAVRGDLLEEEIDEDTTEMICFPGEYNGFIMSISLLPDYRNMDNYNLLVGSLLAQLETYSEKGIFFRRWCMNVFDKGTRALVKSLGFSYICDNKVFGKIFTCNFKPLPNVPLLKRYPKLLKNYEEN